MRCSTGFRLGFAFAIVVIFLLLSGNFESFTVSLAILGTDPRGALVGRWGLWF